jgi:hypothetical protein
MHLHMRDDTFALWVQVYSVSDPPAVIACDHQPGAKQCLALLSKDEGLLSQSMEAACSAGKAMP